MKPYRFDRSLELYQEARRYLAGGVSSHFRSLGRPHPMFFTEGSGVTVRDVDGNEYLDFTLSQGPLLVGLYGLGLIAAGIFVADPINGFPPGLPESSTISWHALLHFVSAAIAFLGLIAACFVFARRFAALRQRGWATYSLVTGILFLGAFIGIASGAKQSALVLAFWGAVIIGWAWLSLLSARLVSELAPMREART